MKDFGQWFNDCKPATPEPELPAGVVAMKPGSGYPRYMVYCCVCEKLDALPVGIDEIDDDYEHYCGGSPRCCP